LQETLVFYGDITTAWGNYQQMPDVFLQIQAAGGYINKLTPVPPTSYQGGVDNNVLAITSLKQPRNTTNISPDIAQSGLAS
jgi:hypothetical protein